MTTTEQLLPTHPPSHTINTRTVIIVVTAALASLLEIIDSSIVNVAIPTMMGNLGVTLDEISWVSTGYMIANSIVLPIAAWLGSRLGRRTYFTSAILAFTLASFACGMAPNLPILVLFRILQGLAGGALLPTSQALIQEQFPREKAALASAIFGMSVMVGPALGPTLGGYLADNFGWRAIFNINVPVGLAAALMSWSNVEDLKGSQSGKKGGVDWTGLALLCIGVGCFQFVLERGEADDWWSSNPIRACGILSVIGTAAFIYWELKVKNPIMNLRLFKENVVRSGTLLMLMLGVMLYALTFVVPIFASTVIQMTATQTGVLFMPGSILTAAAMLPVGIMSRKVNPKFICMIGLAFGIGAVLYMSDFTTATGDDALFIPLALRGLSAAFLFVPINGMVLGKFRGEELGQVAGMQNFFRQIGGSIGIASLSTLMTRFSAQNYVDLMPKVSALSPVGYQSFMQNTHLAGSKMANAIGMYDPRTLSIKAIWGRAEAQVFVMSFNQVCWVIVFVLASALIPLYLIKSQKKLEGPMPDPH